MPGSFWAQFFALCRKNWIILWRHRYINIARCLILPIAYAVFFAQAQNFFTTRGVFGKGSITPLRSIPPDLLGHKFVWTSSPAGASNATVEAEIEQLMGRVLNGVYGQIEKVDNASVIESECRTNFNGLSQCFAAVIFGNMSLANRTLNYTLRGDLGLTQVNVDNSGADDVSVRYLPLQWAIDSTFIEMATGTVPVSPYSWEYTYESNAEFNEDNLLSYLGGIRALIVLAFFLGFLGVVYQLPGGIATERANLLTSHLEAMGCRKSARVISWHLSISSAYFPAWVIIAIVFKLSIWKNTNAGLFIILYILTGLSLASWTQLVAVPFANAPTLAAITSTFIAIILAIGALLCPSTPGIQIVLTLIFPPMFYTFFTKALCSFEQVPLSPNILKRSPGDDAPVLGLLIIAIIDIILFPLLATWLESRLYGVRPPDWVHWWKRLRRSRSTDRTPMAADTAVQLEHVRKVYDTRYLGVFGKKSKNVVAIEDLSFGVPKGEIFCLLGRNGAAKSTTLHTIARLVSVTSGRIRYAEDLHLGIASQKDVLWDELTCRQHINLWRAIKTTPHHQQSETNLDLLARCDLAPKVRFLAKNLSGGQKRKLQLACALAGGSNLLLLDEISSGLDPLSRRAIWKLIIANRGSSTIILTTHFLDEADYLGDTVAILQSPGKLLALDNPVALKTQLGKGWSITVDPHPGSALLREKIEREVRNIIVRKVRGKDVYVTGSTDVDTVRRITGVIEEQRRNERMEDGHGRDWGYQVNSATLEQVFLDLNSEMPSTAAATPLASPPALVRGRELDDDMEVIPLEPLPATGAAKEDHLDLAHEKEIGLATPSASSPTPSAQEKGGLTLTSGSKRSYFLAIPGDAWTMARKRAIILRRAWLLPLIGIIVVICAAAIPLVFLRGRQQTCAFIPSARRRQRLSYPSSRYPIIFTPPVIAPADALGNFTIPLLFGDQLANNETWINDFNAEYTNITYGGISLATPVTSAASVFAWEGSVLESKGQSVMNMMSNAILNTISPLPAAISSFGNAFRINLEFRFLPSSDFTSTAQAMKWIGFFGLGVAIWPAFAVIYPTQERVTNVRANQYSNGATPVSLWLGHLLSEIPGILAVSIVIIGLFAGLTTQFNAPGDLWICFVLYGISATLYAYLFALFMDSALAAWAVVAGSNVILFLLYLASYLLILTYDRSVNASQHITICHFTIALINPVPNLLRAILVSINLFNLLCDGFGNYSSSPYSSILQFGGPILYMVVQAFFAFALLVYVDSGAPLPLWLSRRRKIKTAYAANNTTSADVMGERERLEAEEGDELRVLGLKKRYSGANALAVDDVSFGVGLGDCWALIGPNGAGKTTTLACIRGVELPTAGDVTVAGHSIVKERNAARSYLGVCPQVNAIDIHLTVRQHLWLYGRLKGVPSRALKDDVEALLAASGLSPKADQLATSLSGGNQRKLSLAIALIGGRPVVLIDEFSSGVDPFSKREAWQTLASLTKDRAVVMTTHSMEEVDALASRVGIIASKMLAIGTPASLKSRFATYEIHLLSTEVAPVLDYLHAHGFSDARISLDTLTRISVPGVREEELSRLLEVMQGASRELDVKDMTLHEASTETAFLEIVRQHNIQEEAGKIQQPSWWSRLRGRS